MEKMTLAQYHENVAMVFASIEGFEGAEEMVRIANEKLAQLAAKAEKNKERAAEKARKGDELRAKIQDLLTDEYQTADEIVVALEDEEITKAMVTPRLSALITAGIAVKDKVKREGDKNPKMAYKLATEE